jgi:hypothetical protein
MCIINVVLSIKVIRVGFHRHQMVKICGIELFPQFVRIKIVPERQVFIRNMFQEIQVSVFILETFFNCSELDWTRAEWLINSIVTYFKCVISVVNWLCPFSPTLLMVEAGMGRLWAVSSFLTMGTGHDVTFQVSNCQ